MNNSGAIVADYHTSVVHGFLQVGGTHTTIDDPNAVLATTLFTIDQSGVIVGYYLDGSAVVHGFVATPAAVPEPSTRVLAALGVLTLFAACLRERHSSTKSCFCLRAQSRNC